MNADKIIFKTNRSHNSTGRRKTNPSNTFCMKTQEAKWWYWRNAKIKSSVANVLETGTCSSTVCSTKNSATVSPQRKEKRHKSLCLAQRRHRLHSSEASTRLQSGSPK